MEPASKREELIKKNFSLNATNLLKPLQSPEQQSLGLLSAWPIFPLIPCRLLSTREAAGVSCRAVLVGKISEA